MNVPIFFRLVAFRDLVKLSQTKHIISRNLKRLVHQSLWGEPYKNVEILPVPLIGEDSYSIEEVDFVCMYRHSSRIKQEERVNSNPFQGLVSPTLSKKEQKKLDEYFSDWGFRNEGI